MIFVALLGIGHSAGQSAVLGDEPIGQDGRPSQGERAVEQGDRRSGDRTKCFIPFQSPEATTGSGGTNNRDTEKLGEYSSPDVSISRAGVLPTDALGIDENADGGDLAWWQYLQVWQAHASDNDTAIHRWLGLPLSGEVQVAIRRGRTPPRFLPWKAGSFVVVQTPHFEILSRADTERSARVARDLERLHCVWTQMYFPLWAGRDQIQVAMGDWDPQQMTVTEYFAWKNNMRLSSRARHRVVLLPDAQTYRLTIASPQVAAGANAAISASEGFYSDSLATSFFYPRDDVSSLAHEITHQLFEEATDRPRRSKTAGTTNDFWLIEGIAGHFESFHAGHKLASVGGWDSDRLQYARYQTLIAGQPIADISDLVGNRVKVQRLVNLPRWYSQSILQTHYAMDGGSLSGRVAVLRRLAEIYRVDVSDFASLQALENDRVEPNPADQVRFLTIDDAQIAAYPTHENLTSLCLAGCPVTEAGWSMIPPQKRISWFDGSRTPINDEQVTRILAGELPLEQLSLEATKITPSIESVISNQKRLRELDVSWTATDDSLVTSLRQCVDVETLWLTGTAVTDASIARLARLPNLKTMDVQRTKITDSGLKRLRVALPQLEVNPLQLQ